MLKGIDVSRFQKGFKSFVGYDFVIMKCSEGKTYVDPELNNHYNRLTGTTNGQPSDKLYGFYHYARPESNKPEEEAQFFVSLVGHHKGHCLYVLDWESIALKYDISWAIKWLDYVYKATGVKPLIYVQGSYTRKISKVLQKGYGLWVAHYGVKVPTTGVYQTYALWQYTSKPLDKNYFNGTVEQWKEYCKIQK